MIPGDSSDILQTVRCTVTNTGEREGDEVVQLYMNDRISSVATDPIRLKAFRRIHLKQGESCQIIFNLNKEDLALYNRSMEFVVEPGEFEVMIGAASDDIRLKGGFTLE